MDITEQIVEDSLIEMLDGLLSRGNQEGSFEVKKVDLENMKFTVEFNIVIVEDDNYIGFQGY